MPTPLAQTAEEASRELPFWLILGVLAIALITAFWTVCSQQVQKAQARNATVQQQVAVNSVR